MKNLIFATLLVFSIASIAQTRAPEPEKKVIRISTPKMTINASDPTVKLVPMQFNGAINTSLLEGITADRIATVSLVYTQYKLNERFDQLELNARRTDQLYRILPQLAGNDAVQWYWVEQTGCDNSTVCNDFFHGFVITLKSEETSIKTETEVALMDYYTSMYEGKADPTKVDSLIATGKLTLVKICVPIERPISIRKNKMARISGWDGNVKKKFSKYFRDELNSEGVASFDLILSKKGKFVFDGESKTISSSLLKALNEHVKAAPAKYHGKRIDARVKFSINQVEGKLFINTFQQPILPNGEEFRPDSFDSYTIRDTICNYIDTARKNAPLNMNYSAPDVVTKVFERNTKWNNCLIATDVTGSMYPYLAQFKHWHKLHMTAKSGNHDFMFFNDGNNMPDHVKKAGEVGGLFYINTVDFDSMSNIMRAAMMSGSGGDGPENNIEAVIQGLKRNPNCREVIMIADNWATPRDVELLSQVKVPIRFIICGAGKQINTAYLELARDCGGSIHTIEHDIYELEKVSEGKSVKIEGVVYTFKGGKFVVN